MSEHNIAIGKPDNTVTMEINGTTYIINEFLSNKGTINDIITNRIKRELDPFIPSGNSG